MHKIRLLIKRLVGDNTKLYWKCRRLYIIISNIFSKHGYILQYMIFPLFALFRKHHIKPFFDDNAAKLEKLRNTHIGKRCFIIATGPSLKVEDIEQLDGEITIGVNSLYKIYDRTEFRPNYYICLDEMSQIMLEENIGKYERKISKDGLFLNALKKTKIEDAGYLYYCYQDHWFNVDNPKYKFENLRYSTDLVEGIYDKCTVTNAAIDFAIYCGCKEIYLLGVDCNYNGPKKYFDDVDSGDIFVGESGERMAFCIQRAMIAGYKFMEKETKKRGIHIYNATRGGMLEEFDRVDFDEIIRR